MITLQHADLRDVGKTESPVGGGIIELSGVEELPVHRRDDLCARQRVHRGTYALEKIDRDVHSAELHPLEVVGFGDRLLVPTEGLRWHRAIRKGDDIGAERVVDSG